MWAYQRDVLAFHVKFGSGIGNVKRPAVHNGKFRSDFIHEETREFVRALKDDDAIEMVDALCDLHYVTIGSGIEFGIDMTKIVAEFVDTQRPDPDMALIDHADEWIERFRYGAKRCEQEIASGDIKAVSAALAAEVVLIRDAVRAWGINLRPFWKEVQRSNMAKVPSGRIDVKTIKPPGWRKPDLGPILIAQYEAAASYGSARVVNA